MKRYMPYVLAALSLAPLSACQSAGTGSASSLSGDVRADLSWQSSSGHSGTMRATLNNGASFTGSYFQIADETRLEDVHPLWDGWGRPWPGWELWQPSDWPQFVTHYSGRVVANLKNPNGAHMRCWFYLAQPEQGMPGGGQGECQLPDGRSIDAVFPQSQS